MGSIKKNLCQKKYLTKTLFSFCNSEFRLLLLLLPMSSCFFPAFLPYQMDAQFVRVSRYIVGFSIGSNDIVWKICNSFYQQKFFFFCSRNKGMPNSLLNIIQFFYACQKYNIFITFLFCIEPIWYILNIFRN